MNLGGTVRLNRTGVIIIAVICVIFMLYNITGEKTLATINKQRAPPILVSLRKFLLAAIEAAENGGKEVVQVSKDATMQIKSKGKTKEGASDSVTNADFRSHCVMFGGLQKAFPTVKIISEEPNVKCEKESTLPLTSSPLLVNENSLPIEDSFIDAAHLTVWIDPLDATQEFTERMFDFVTTMVCLAVDGKPIIGVIHNPFQNYTSWAWVGHGSSKDLLSIPKNEGTDHPRIIVSRSHKGNVVNILQRAFGGDVEIIRAAGAGYKTLAVAHGNATAYVHTTAIKKWDTCAGNAILNSIDGGQMTTIQNKVIDYTNPGLVVNDKGLLGTLFNHDWYIQTLDKIVNMT